MTGVLTGSSTGGNRKGAPDGVLRPGTTDAASADVVSLPYGKGELIVPRVPGSHLVARADPAPISDLTSVLHEALRSPIGCLPLGELARGVTSVVIAVCDATRPQPRVQVLDALVSELGDRPEVTVIIATGSHVPLTPDQELELLGRAICERCRVISHDARDQDSLTFVGTVGNEVPLWLNRAWVDSELRISAGVVEPHFFAGFSGGPKMVAPGLAGLDTILVLHDARRIGDPRATFGLLDDNPVSTDVRACAGAMPPHLTVEMTLDHSKKATSVFAGELFSAHALACAAAAEAAIRPVDRRYDVVVTTNSGYPLDQNLYQAVKGMAVADQIVSPGGTIVIASECIDGLPSGSAFGDLIMVGAPFDDPDGFFDRQASARVDQWQLQVLHRILERAKVFVHSTGLSEADLMAARLSPAPDVAAVVQEAVDRGASGSQVCYVPHGPQTVPYVRRRRGEL